MQHLDNLGSKAELESARFGQHVKFLDHGLENFKDQVGAFRKVVADNAKSELGETRRILKAGQFLATSDQFGSHISGREALRQHYAKTHGQNVNDVTSSEMMRSSLAQTAQTQ